MAFCMEFPVLLLSLHTSSSQVIWQGSGSWLIHALKWAKKDSEFPESRGNFFYFFFLIKGSCQRGQIVCTAWSEQVPVCLILKCGNIIPSQCYKGGCTQKNTEALGRNFKISWKIFITFEDFLFGVYLLGSKVYSVCMFYTHTCTHHTYTLSLSLSLSHTHTHTHTHAYPSCELIHIPPRLFYAKLDSPVTEFALALYFFFVLLSLCNLSITYYSHSVACIFNYTLKIVSHTNSFFVMVDFVLFFTFLFNL